MNASPKRAQNWKNFRHSKSKTVKKLLKKCLTRWLSLEQAIKRILELWEDLREFFLLEVTEAQKPNPTNRKRKTNEQPKQTNKKRKINVNPKKQKFQKKTDKLQQKTGKPQSKGTTPTEGQNKPAESSSKELPKKPTQQTEQTETQGLPNYYTRQVKHRIKRKLCLKDKTNQLNHPTKNLSAKLKASWTP